MQGNARALAAPTSSRGGSGAVAVNIGGALSGGGSTGGAGGAAGPQPKRRSTGPLPSVLESRILIPSSAEATPPTPPPPGGAVAGDPLNSSSPPTPTPSPSMRRDSVGSSHGPRHSLGGSSFAGGLRGGSGRSDTNGSYSGARLSSSVRRTSIDLILAASSAGIIEPSPRMSTGRVSLSESTTAFSSQGSNSLARSNNGRGAGWRTRVFPEGVREVDNEGSKYDACEVARLEAALNSQSTPNLLGLSAAEEVESAAPPPPPPGGGRVAQRAYSTPHLQIIEPPRGTLEEADIKAELRAASPLTPQRSGHSSCAGPCDTAGTSSASSGGAGEEGDRDFPTSISLPTGVPSTAADSSSQGAEALAKPVEGIIRSHTMPLGDTTRGGYGKASFGTVPSAVQAAANAAAAAASASRAPPPVGAVVLHQPPGGPQNWQQNPLGSSIPSKCDTLGAWFPLLSSCPALSLAMMPDERACRCALRSESETGRSSRLIFR